MHLQSLGHRAPLLWVLLPLSGGLIAARCVEPTHMAVLLGVALVLAIVAVVASFLKSGSWLWGIAIATSLFLAGQASYALHRQRLRDWESLPPREVQLAIRIDRVFAGKDPRKASGLGSVTSAEGVFSELRGQKIYYSATVRPNESLPRRSAIIRLRGVLASVSPDAEPDSFEGYLAGSGVNFRINRARVLAEERAPTTYYRFCDRALARFRRILGVGIEAKQPEAAGLLRAMMLGETGDLTEDQHTVFMQSGTMHLFAISGLNIGVIAGSIQALLAILRLPRSARFLIGTPLLWLFVDITGAAPSAVRAFAMAVFFQGATVTQRPANTFAALVGAATLVVLWAPFQLFSASFAMSYDIVAALFLLGLPLGEAWLRHWRPWRDLPSATRTLGQRVTAWAWEGFVPVLAVGISTTLVGMLTSVRFFHLLTPGALVANLVLIPIAMIVTAGGFVALLCGLGGFMSGAALFNHAAALLLLLIEKLVRLSVHVPGAVIPAHFRSSWIGGAGLIAVLAALLIGYGLRWQRQGGGWWPPFAIAALIFVIGVSYP